MGTDILGTRSVLGSGNIPNWLMQEIHIKYSKVPSLADVCFNPPNGNFWSK